MRVESLLKTHLHLVVCGSPGTGKTTLIKQLLMSLESTSYYVIDWGGDYNDLPASVLVPPFPLPRNASLPCILDLMGKPLKKGCEVADVVRVAVDGRLLISPRELVQELQAFARKFPCEEALTALARAKVLQKNFEIGEVPHPPVRFDLSSIVNCEEKTCVLQALVSSLILARPYFPSDNVILVIEDGGWGATKNFLRVILADARRKGVKIIYVTDNLPPPAVLTNFALVVFNPGVARYLWTRRLGIPIPPLKQGEALYYDGVLMKRIRIQLTQTPRTKS